MEKWNKLATSLASIDASGFVEGLGFNRQIQAVKEKLGQVSAEDMTELPPEYKELEAKVDALRDTHETFYKIVKVYASGSYDYPTQIQESILDLSSSVGATVTNFAATNLQGTNLPSPAPVQPKPAQHKTLPHAFHRASLTALSVLSGPCNGLPVETAVAEYGTAWETIATARIIQDKTIRESFLQPWETTMSTNIKTAMEARNHVHSSRLDLDAAKQTLKSAGPGSQDAARIKVENAEDDLVQKTEVAIQLMKTVLDSPETVNNLSELVKAQLLYYTAAADALAEAQAKIESLPVAA